MTLKTRARSGIAFLFPMNSAYHQQMARLDLLTLLCGLSACAADHFVGDGTRDLSAPIPSGTRDLSAPIPSGMRDLSTPIICTGRSDCGGARCCISEGNLGTKTFCESPASGCGDGVAGVDFFESALCSTVADCTNVPPSLASGYTCCVASFYDFNLDPTPILTTAVCAAIITGSNADAGTCPRL